MSLSKTTWKKVWKRGAITLASLVTLGVTLFVVLISIIWFRPHWILTPPRVSKLAGLALVVTDSKGGPTDAPVPLTLQIEPIDLKIRKFTIGLAPGCYALKESITPGISFCDERGALAFTIRLHWTGKIIPSFKLTALNQLDFVFSKFEALPQPESKAKEEPQVNTGPPAWMKYLAENFAWGPLHLEAKEFRVGSSGMIIRGKFTNLGGEVSNPISEKGLDSPTLDFDVKVEAKAFTVSAKGKVEGQGKFIVVPSAKATYESVEPKHSSKPPMKITAKLDARYDLVKSLLTANFEAMWKNPVDGIAEISTKKSTFQMDPVGMEAATEVAMVLKGKTPLGRLPVLRLGVGASMKNAKEGEPSVVDAKIALDSYTFAGIHATSDLEVRITARGESNELELRRGELKVEAKEFHNTVKALERTSWAVPAPFAVLQGPIVLRTTPFRSFSDRVEIPVLLNADLHSREQVIQFETQAMLALSAKTLKPLRTSIDVFLKNITLRLPDYDPLAPVPAYARDPRIVREEDIRKKAEKAEKKANAPPEPDMPISLSVHGAPGSIKLLNRYFDPAFTAGADFKMIFASETGTPTGHVSLATPFEIKYLNRSVTLESLTLSLDPLVRFSCLVSMKRSGYRITATVNQALGKTQIKLASQPPLENDEIVSLLIYGMPKNTISSEQTKSVGSAQSAMSSDALGIFSFFAFASTPIQSVRYDTATQTYSAVVSLPGGVVASIGSSWDNERQVSLSKSLGRNWAVSTELIKDTTGVDRGGTLLRWRKSY